MALLTLFRRKDDAPVRAEARYPALVIAALVLLGLILLIFLFADWLAPYDYRTQSLLKRLKPPSFLGGMPEHLLGTDELGRDVLSRLIYAIRFSVLVALGGTLIGALLLGVLNNSLNMIGLSPYSQRVVKGVILLVAVLIGYLRKQNSR